MSNDNNNKDDKFTSAMDDLKGILDKEGINLNSDKRDNDKHDQDAAIPTLNTLKIDIPDVAEPEENFSHSDLSATDLPVLDGTITVVDETDSDSEGIDLDDYISDIEDDNFALNDFASSFAELEEKVESITDPEHLHKFEHSEAEHPHLISPSETEPAQNSQPEASSLSISRPQLDALKIELQNKLSLQIDTALNELRVQLTDSMHREIKQILDNLSSE